ncbi:MAG: 50S ribosomal protein L17 [Chloroflexi bacterium]|nr:50S ribosomal protein L17 [Chloroflexota bacterium]
MAGRHFGRSTGHRTAMFRNLITELFRHGRITTTEAKAKAIRADAEQLITVAKSVDPENAATRVHARREVAKVLYDKDVAIKLLQDIAPKFSERKGGYTRLLKLGPRQGDNAPMVLLELVD